MTSTRPSTRHKNIKGFMRLKQILEIIPFGKTTIWHKVKTGEFPKPVKLSERVTAWRASDIEDYIEKFSKSRELGGDNE